MSGRDSHPPTKADGDVITPAEHHHEQLPIPKTAANADKAAAFIASHGATTFDYEEERSVLKQIDRRVLPLILGAYFFQQLDKSSLSYVSIFGIIEDAKLEASEYSWLSSILYIAQLIFQPLAAWLLVKFPTGKVIGIAILCWGSCAALMAAVSRSVYCKTSC